MSANPADGSRAASLYLGQTVNGVPAYRFYTDDATGDILEIYSYRWGGKTLFTRSSNDGLQKIISMGGDDGSHYIDLHDSTTDAVNIHLDSENASYFNGGKIGIGTTAPGAKLEVVDPTAAELRISSSATGSFGPAKLSFISEKGTSTE